jgi:hypothetical protein
LFAMRLFGHVYQDKLTKNPEFIYKTWSY